MTTTCKAKKGDLVVWEETHTSYQINPCKTVTSSHWYIGKVSHASREGAVKTAGLDGVGRGDSCRDFDRIPTRLVMAASAFTVPVDELIAAVKDETPWNRSLEEIKNVARRFLRLDGKQDAA
jgi:hypothetical protein